LKVDKKRKRKEGPKTKAHFSSGKNPRGGGKTSSEKTSEHPNKTKSEGGGRSQTFLSFFARREKKRRKAGKSRGRGEKKRLRRKGEKNPEKRKLSEIHWAFLALRLSKKRGNMQ